MMPSVRVSDLLPMPAPDDPGEDARRIVRHGLADVLRWLGEPIGPAPGAACHALRTGTTLFVSQELRDRLAGVCHEIPTGALRWWTRDGEVGRVT